MHEGQGCGFEVGETPDSGTRGGGQAGGVEDVLRLFGRPDDVTFGDGGTISQVGEQIPRTAVLGCSPRTAPGPPTRAERAGCRCGAPACHRGRSPRHRPAAAADDRPSRRVTPCSPARHGPPRNPARRRGTGSPGVFTPIFMIMISEGIGTAKGAPELGGHGLLRTVSAPRKGQMSVAGGAACLPRSCPPTPTFKVCYSTFRQ